MDGKGTYQAYEDQENLNKSYKDSKLNTYEIKKKYLKSSEYENRDWYTPKVQNAKKDSPFNYSAKEHDYKSRKSKSPILNEFKLGASKKDKKQEINGFVMLKILG